MRELYGWIRERLAEGKMPARWWLVDAIPRSERGKVNREAVREACASRPPLDLARILQGALSAPAPPGAVLAFLRTIQKPDRPLDTVAETESLVESGLIDSFAVLEIVAFLEEQYRIDFAASGSSRSSSPR